MFWAPPVAGQDLQWDWIQPRLAGTELTLPESEGKAVRYGYMTGRGIGCADTVVRRLEKGTMPILHTSHTDEDITYESVAFVSCETSALRPGDVRGTPYLIADRYGFGHMQLEEQRAECERQERAEADTEQEALIYYCRVTARNEGRVPRYAWFKNPVPNAGALHYDFDPATGFAQYGSDRIYCVSQLNGAPLRDEETALLLGPGECAEFLFYLPHEPIGAARAAALREQPFQKRYSECRSYWQEKLCRGGSVRLPESRMQEMLQAGRLHLDLGLYGREPDQPLVPSVGIYTGIGSESAPIIQFFDSIGWHEEARRAIMFFLEKQHDNGFMQNFGGYMLETGAVLWTIGEHYRYTQDAEWLLRVKDKLLKAYRCLLEWRSRNEREELKGRGYGLLDGKTADPEDPYHSFMLNGYAYAGLSRLAEMLEQHDPAIAQEVAANARLLRERIRSALREAMERSPVIPLADGSWAPTAPPWAEARGPLALYADPGKCYTHGTFAGRDSLLGPLHLIYQEVIEPNEEMGRFLLHAHNELLLGHNTAFSQPYYSMHPWIHLKRGEAAPFLKAFYMSCSGLADRETYTFWEHFYQVSAHKTHEEAWFLMQLRWMLYMEEGDSLRLLPGIPRRWLQRGKGIVLEKMVSYYGPFSFTVHRSAHTDSISAQLRFHEPERMPKHVKLRVPHISRKRPVSVSGGVFHPEEECVEVPVASEAIEVELHYD